MRRVVVLAALIISFCVVSYGQSTKGMEHSVHDLESLRECMHQIGELEKQGNSLELAHQYRYTGNYFYKTPSSDSTIHYYRLALRQYEIAGDSFHIQYTKFRIGQTISWEKKYPESALEWLVPSARYFEKKKDHLLAAHAFYSLSDTYKSMSNDSLEQVYLKKSREENRFVHDTTLDIILSMDEVDKLIDSEKFEEAIILARETANLTRKSNREVFLKGSLTQLGKALLYTGKVQEAIHHLEESVRLGHTHNLSHSSAHFLLGISYLRTGNISLAETYFAKYKSIAEAEEARKEKDNYEELVVQYELGKKEAAITVLEKENLLRASNARQQQLFIIALAMGMLFLMLSIWFITFTNRKRRKLQEIILKQQEEYSRNLFLEKEQTMSAEFNKQLAEVQLIALNAQMNPHFIFNCMNSIQKYILKNEKVKAMEFLQHFSELMRKVLENSMKTNITLDEEISMLEKYISLEQLRLDGKFDYQIRVEDSLQADFFEIPGMIIQPYVENAIWHGLMHKQEKGKLQLSFNRENSSVVCIVQDNGVGRNKAAELERTQTIRRKSYGIYLAQKRLELLRHEYEEMPVIQIEDMEDEAHQPTGTKVTIHFHIEN